MYNKIMIYVDPQFSNDLLILSKGGGGVSIEQKFKNFNVFFCFE